MHTPKQIETWARESGALAFEQWTGGRNYYFKNIEQLTRFVGASSGGHLRVRFDDRKHVWPLHPTWEVEYLEPQP